MNILIVDDRDENRYLLETLLKGHGHDVQSAAHGAQALERLEEGGVELIISDILMPVMDGFQLCRKVKANETLRRIPFIIYTATYTGPQDEALALKIGADRFIQKPCEPDVFMKAVGDVMAEAGSCDIAPTREPAHEEEILKLYNERLVRKLEQKMLQLEEEVRARRQLEETLRASERKYRLLADNTQDVIWAMNLDLTFNYVNPAIRSLTGHSPEEWIESRLSDHCDEENFARMLQVIADETSKGRHDEGVILEATLLKKNREPIPVEIHGRVICDEDGTPVLLQGTTRNISERKEAEKALKEAYEIMNRSSSVAFTWKNQEGWPVEFVSENVERLLGYTAEEFLTGKVDYVGCVHPDDLPRVAEEVAEAGSEKELTEFFHEPYRIRTKDGSEKTISDWTYIVRDGDGLITHYKGVVEDITEQTRGEKEREKLHEQLLQAQRLEAVGRLTGGIAHDFNNLLTTVIGNADMAIGEVEKGSDLYEFLEDIRGAGERAATLTRQLLAFSRKQVRLPEVMDLNEVVGELDKILRRIIGEDIELETVPASDLGMVEADIGQLEQVIMNLVVNARDAMPGGGRLTIETANVELDDEYAKTHVAVTPGPHVMLGISDTGVGMSPEVQAQVFEPFFTTKGKSKGTGLGLSTVYGIVKQSGGNIWVYSEMGKGTVFKIYLPRVDKACGGGKGEAVKVEARGGSETVLVVEDEERVLRLAVRVLEGMGYRVLAAGDGEEAMELSEGLEGPIDLLLTDVVMPRMNGRELFGRLEGLRPEMKVLFMSGYADNAIVHNQVLDSGIAFIQKPFTGADLGRKVRKVLDT